MKNILDLLFNGLAYAFDKIPMLNKFKGLRSAIGLIAMGIISVLDWKGIGGGNLGELVNPYLIAFTGLSLLAHNTETVK